jgi:hypothetical protein
MDGTCRTTERDKKCLNFQKSLRESALVFVCVILWHCQDLNCIQSSGRMIDEFESIRKKSFIF